jgi:hypothetical protein
MANWRFSQLIVRLNAHISDTKIMNINEIWFNYLVKFPI